MARTRSSTLARRGFTLLEGLIATVVLAISVVSIAGALAASSTQARLLQEDYLAAAQARELMEEIAARPLRSVNASDRAGFDEGCTTIDAYDDVGDFAGYTDTGSARILAVEGEDLTEAIATPTGTIDDEDQPSGGSILDLEVDESGVTAGALGFLGVSLGEGGVAVSLGGDSTEQASVPVEPTASPIPLPDPTLRGDGKLTQTNFRRKVTVEYRDRPDGPPSASGHFALVTVTISPADGRGRGYTLRRLFADVPVQR